jgi:hypothetical protein
MYSFKEPVRKFGLEVDFIIWDRVRTTSSSRLA